MKKELIMEDLKWVLDFKTLEIIKEQGYALVSVRDLIKMCNEWLKGQEEILEIARNNKQEELKDMMDTLIQNSLISMNKTNEIMEILLNNNLDKLVRFERGC